jgi:hypothetical protein
MTDAGRLKGAVQGFRNILSFLSNQEYALKKARRPRNLSFLGTPISFPEKERN